MRASGKWVVVGVLVAAALAALGTCHRFTNDRPMSRQILECKDRLVTAEFLPDERLETGMMASVSVQGGKVGARVVGVESSGGRLRIVVEMEKAIPAGQLPENVMIDTTVPPVLLKPAGTK